MYRCICLFFVCVWSLAAPNLIASRATRLAIRSLLLHRGQVKAGQASLVFAWRGPACPDPPPLTATKVGVIAELARPLAVTVAIAAPVAAEHLSVPGCHPVSFPSDRGTVAGPLGLVSSTKVSQNDYLF